MGGAVACFGKLPFHREFLRIGLESPGARWMVTWIEGVHEAWAKGDGGPSATPLVRFVVPVPDGTGVIVGITRQSSDGLRRHPVTVFVEWPAAVASNRWHLLPLVCASTWTSLAALLASEFESARAFAEAVAATTCEETSDAFEQADDAYRARLEQQATAAAWTALTGVSDDVARHVAANLLAVAGAQRAAGGSEEGVSLIAPIAGSGPDPILAGVWLELFATVVGPSCPPAAVMLRDDHPALFSFYRPLEAIDLAAVLTSPEMAPIDDLSEPWQTLPPSDPSVAAQIERLVAGGAEPLSALLARVAGPQ